MRLLGLLICAVGCGSSSGSADEQSGDATSGSSSSTGDSREGRCQGGIGLVQGETEVPAGIEWCPGLRMFHRYEPVEACTHVDVDAEECSEDQDCAAECADVEHGYCGPSGTSPCVCQQSCLADGDCANAESCHCRSNLPTATPAGQSQSNQCLVSNCRSDADCDEGRCLLSFDICGRPAGSHCQTAADECQNSRDCDCTFDLTAGRWSCLEGSCG